MIEEVHITKYKVEDKIFDTAEQAEEYEQEELKAEKRLKSLMIQTDIKIPDLLYIDLVNGVIAKSDSGFQFFKAKNASDLKFLYKYANKFNPFDKRIRMRTPCVVAINKFRHMFLSLDEIIRRGEELNDRYIQYSDDLAEMKDLVIDINFELRGK